MKKRILIILLLVCFLSIVTNIFQFNRIRKYNTEECLYTATVENSFKEFIAGLDYYDGKATPLSNESAIKNSVSAVAGMRNIAPLSSYKDNKQLSLMLLNLDMFFVMESSEYINDNVKTIKPQLTNISKNLNDEKAISELNTVLEKLLSNK
ncbi:hypothetical protein CSC2_35630 [Clostridium zeae]|uniref:DUF4825 domain-containing protein n=1 Tax=Clostridium zeae TaxID=2759022 RepID=A0ABQ1EE11_9CLOT|nr:hypothetical protein [Clostridium zeae]GFZ33037.1 hypothetical protein CSC2_35630 [Clostridium zeae]